MRQIKQNKIQSDIANNWFFLLILAIGTIPSILSGYSMYLLVILLPIILFKGRVKLNFPVIISLLFGIMYTLPLLIHSNPPTLSIAIFYILYPMLFYLIPNYLMKRFRNPNTMFIVLIIVITCIASWSITMNIVDTILSGQLVNMRRSLSDNIKDFQGVVSATNHNMMLSLAIGGIGMIFVSAKNALERREKNYLILLGCLAIFSAFHLLNRTAIILALAAITIAFFSQKFNSKRIISFLLTLIVLLVIFYLVFKDSKWMDQVLSGFESREKVSGHGLSSAGARDVRWLGAIRQIPHYVFGADALYLNGAKAYAHNLWLDCGIQAGWIALTLLLIITFKFIKSAIKVIKLKSVPVFQRSFYAIVTVIIMLQCMVEPVIQGVVLLFFMIFFLWSMFDSILAKDKQHNRK